MDSIALRHRYQDQHYHEDLGLYVYVSRMRFDSKHVEGLEARLACAFETMVKLEKVNCPGLLPTNRFVRFCRNELSAFQARGGITRRPSSPTHPNGRWRHKTQTGEYRKPPVGKRERHHLGPDVPVPMALGGDLQDQATASAGRGHLHAERFVAQPNGVRSTSAQASG